MTSYLDTLMLSTAAVALAKRLPVIPSLPEEPHLEMEVTFPCTAPPCSGSCLCCQPILSTPSRCSGG